MKIRLTATTILKLVATIAVAIVLLTWGGIRIQSARQSAIASSCISNLKQIGLALHRYHDQHGSFPPAYITNNTGRPIHSWRVLILPYLERQDLYDQYRFDEPWNSANNRRLLQFMPEEYRCHAEKNVSGTTTNYLFVVGQHAACHGATALRLSDTKGFPTIMVVEVVNSGIDWMEPRDLALDDAVRGVNTGTKPGISSYHPQVANCLFVDGSAHSLSNNISLSMLGVLLRIDAENKFGNFSEPIGENNPKMEE